MSAEQPATPQLPDSNPIDKLIPLIATTTNTWLEKAMQDIQQQVIQKLDKSRDEIVLKLLGFDKDSWRGNWSLDHCNGRAGESAAGTFLRNTHAEAIKEWLSNFQAPLLSPKDKKDLEKRFKDIYLRECESSVYNMAKSKAERDMCELLESITPSKQIDNYLKTVSLIDPPQTN